MAWTGFQAYYVCSNFESGMSVGLGDRRSVNRSGRSAVIFNGFNVFWPFWARACAISSLESFRVIGFRRNDFKRACALESIRPVA